jgi:WD40 repeat protein
MEFSTMASGEGGVEYSALVPVKCKMNRKKRFEGHPVGGYPLQCDFSREWIYEQHGHYSHKRTKQQNEDEKPTTQEETETERERERERDGEGEDELFVDQYYNSHIRSSSSSSSSPSSFFVETQMKKSRMAKRGGSVLATGAADGRVYCYDWQTSRLLRTLSPPPLPQGYPSFSSSSGIVAQSEPKISPSIAVAFHPVLNNHLAVGWWNGQIAIYR